MARPGITYLEVATAATKLHEQNTRPSIEAIRRELGTGSNSTINKYLREWRAKQGNQIELEQGLPESLLIAVKGLYESMQEDAAKTIAISEAESKQSIAEIKTRLESESQQCRRFSQDNKKLEADLAESQAYTQSLSKQLAELKDRKSVV